MPVTIVHAGFLVQTLAQAAMIAQLAGQRVSSFEIRSTPQGHAAHSIGAPDIGQITHTMIL